MTGIRINKRGNYACEFCDHSSWKQRAAAENHVQREHPEQLKIAELEQQLKRERLKKQTVQTVEKVVYKEKPKPKYTYHDVCCVNCRLAFHTGIPFGQTIEETPHSDCGTRTMIKVTIIR